MIQYEEENVSVKKRKAAVLWKLLIVAAAIILAALWAWSGSAGQKEQAVEEKAYEVALEQVKRDLDPWPVSFPPFDRKFITLQGDGLYNVEVQVETKNRYGMKKQYVYEVKILPEKGGCLPVQCMRRF